MQTLDDWAFLVGPVAGVLLLPLVWSVGYVKAPGARQQQVLTVVAVVSGVCVVAHWAFWWFAFDWQEGESTPNGLFGISTGLSYAAAAGCLVTLGAAVAHLRRGRSDSPTRASAADG